MKRIVATVLLALPLLAACGGPDPDIGKVRTILEATKNPLSAGLDDAALTRLGELVCADPDNPKIGLVAAGLQSARPGTTDTEAIQVATLVQSEFCPA